MGATVGVCHGAKQASDTTVLNLSKADEGRLRDIMIQAGVPADKAADILDNIVDKMDMGNVRPTRRDFLQEGVDDAVVDEIEATFSQARVVITTKDVGEDAALSALDDEEDSLSPIAAKSDASTVAKDDPLKRSVSNASSGIRSESTAGDTAVHGGSGPEDGGAGAADRVHDADRTGGVRRMTSREHHEQQLVREGFWRIGKFLGSGTFGDVFIGMNDANGSMFAVKVVSLQGQKDEVKALDLEIGLMKTLHHPNIVAYLGAELKMELGRFYIFQEYAPGGSLDTVLRNFGGYFSPAVCQRYTRQVLCGLAYLHENKIIHRDIKGGNILVDDHGIIKLADFGCSKRLGQDGTLEGARTMKGTPYFMAPEVLMQDRYGRKADVWSVGGVVLQMITGDPPWKQLRLKGPWELFQRVRSTEDPPPMPSDMPEPILTFALRCFERDPSRRPSAKELLEDRWLTMPQEEAEAIVPPTITRAKKARERSASASHAMGRAMSLGDNKAVDRRAARRFRRAATAVEDRREAAQTPPRGDKAQSAESGSNSCGSSKNSSDPNHQSAAEDGGTGNGSSTNTTHSGSFFDDGRDQGGGESGMLEQLRRAASTRDATGRARSSLSSVAEGAPHRPSHSAGGQRPRARRWSERRRDAQSASHSPNAPPLASDLPTPRNAHSNPFGTRARHSQDAPRSPGRRRRAPAQADAPLSPAHNPFASRSRGSSASAADADAQRRASGNPFGGRRRSLNQAPAAQQQPQQPQQQQEQQQRKHQQSQLQEEQQQEGGQHHQQKEQQQQQQQETAQANRFASRYTRKDRSAPQKKPSFGEEMPEDAAGEGGRWRGGGRFSGEIDEGGGAAGAGGGDFAMAIYGAAGGGIRNGSAGVGPGLGGVLEEELQREEEDFVIVASTGSSHLYAS